MEGIEAEVIAKRAPDHDAGHVGKSETRIRTSHMRGLVSSHGPTTEVAGNVKRQAQRPPVGAPAMTDGSGNVVPFNSEALPNNKRKLKARKA